MSVIVVGGGITGLAAARRLRHAGEDVILLEAGDRLGGKIVTHQLGEVIVEGGPDWFITREPNALALCLALGLADELVVPEVTGTLVARGGELRPFPTGLVRGVPTSARAARASGVLSLRGQARLLADYVLPGRLRGPDVAIGSFVRRRLGDEVVERLVDPMLAASRSGRVDEVSLAAGAPELNAAARSSRSLMRGLRRGAAGPPRAPSPFYGLRGGMARLVDAVAADSAGAELRTSAPAERVDRHGSEWTVTLAGGETVAGRAVIVATPAPNAVALLEHAAPEAARRLAGIVYEPSVVVGLVYPAGTAVPPAGASGVLVPRGERRTVTACAWFSAKWPHVTSPGGPDVIRAFVGGAAAGDPVDAIVERAAADVAVLTGAPTDPEEVAVSRWERALPVFAVGHLDMVDEIGDLLPPGLLLAGAAYRGSGLPDCIRGAEEAAEALLGER